MRARTVLAALTTTAMSFGMLALSTPDALATAPPMAVTLSPTSGQVGVPADYVFTFKANQAIAGGTILAAIPAGWTTPQPPPYLSVGALAVNRGTCSSVNTLPQPRTQSGGWTQVAISAVNCPSGGRLTLSYHAASAPHAGSFTFGPTSIIPGPGKAAATIGSPTVNVQAGVTTHLAVTPVSTAAAAMTTVAGGAYRFVVTPQDVANETSSFSGTIQFASSDRGFATVLPAPYLLTGSHTFTATLTTAGAQSLTAVATPSTAIHGTLSGVVVTPAATSQLTWSTPTLLDPAPAGTPAGLSPAGSALSYTVTARDRYGNVTPSFAGSVATSSTTDAAAMLPSPYTFQPATDQGSHAFALTPGTAGAETYTATVPATSTTPVITGSTTVPVGIGIQQTPPPASGTVGSTFSQAFTAIGATGSVTWSGSGLPSGLSLDPATGVLSGTPTSAGTAQSYTISATDSAATPNQGARTFSVDVGLGSQTVTFTSTAPTDAKVGDPGYTPTATATSGLPAAITVDSSSSTVCALGSDGSVTYLAAGTCTLDADQAGDGDWQPAPQVQQSFTVTDPAPVPVINFDSTAPTDAAVGGTAYTPQASATPTVPVVLSIDPASTSVCTLNGDGTVTYQAVGTCTIDADQGGTIVGNAATQVQQSFTVAKGTRTLLFTSTAPTNAVLAGQSYTPAAVATPSSAAATVTVDPASASVCAISPTTGAVNMTDVGTCTLDANLPGDANYNDAAPVQQSFTVGDAAMSIVVDPIDNPQVVTVPPNATAANCDQQIPAAGGCAIDSLEADEVHVFDASGSIDPPVDPTNPTPDAGFDSSLFTIGYHWQIYKPPGLGTALYSSNGITGYHASVLTVQPSSLPELQGTRAGTDIYWSVELTLTVNGHTYTAFFRFVYFSSTLTLQLSSLCQQPSWSLTTLQQQQCALSATNGLAATEPT